MKYMKLGIFLFILCFFIQIQSVSAQGLRIVRDQEIENIIKKISNPVFEQAGFSKDDIRIIIVQSHGINAFVAGGKNIFINTGLMLETESPDEMLGVIAHETSHIASGHLIRTQDVAEGISMQTLLVTIAGVAAALAGSSDAGAAIITGGQAMGITSFLKHSRTQESAADHGGISYLKGAGISPKGFLSFMKKLEHEELLPLSQQSEYIRTHPLTKDRINFLSHAVEISPYKNKQMPLEHRRLYARAKAKLMGFTMPDRTLHLKDKTSLPARYAITIALYRKGRIKESLSTLNKLIAEEPKNPYFHELKGQILFENGQNKKAIASYKRSVELLPDAGLIQIDYAHALIEQAQNLKNKNIKSNLLITAIKTLQQANRYEKKNPKLYHFLGIAYGANNQEGLARLNLAEEAILKNKLSDAERQLSYAIANLPDNATQARLRAQDLRQVIEKRRKKKQKK